MRFGACASLPHRRIEPQREGRDAKERRLTRRNFHSTPRDFFSFESSGVTSMAAARPVIFTGREQSFMQGSFCQNAFSLRRAVVHVEALLVGHFDRGRFFVVQLEVLSVTTSLRYRT